VEDVAFLWVLSELHRLVLPGSLVPEVGFILPRQAHVQEVVQGLAVNLHGTVARASDAVHVGNPHEGHARVTSSVAHLR
jgi:hypothetical protein